MLAFALSPSRALVLTKRPPPPPPHPFISIKLSADDPAKIRQLMYEDVSSDEEDFGPDGEEEEEEEEEEEAEAVSLAAAAMTTTTEAAEAETAAGAAAATPSVRSLAETLFPPLVVYTPPSPHPSHAAAPNQDDQPTATEEAVSRPTISGSEALRLTKVTNEQVALSQISSRVTRRRTMNPPKSISFETEEPEVESQERDEVIREELRERLSINPKGSMSSDFYPDEEEDKEDDNEAEPELYQNTCVRVWIWCVSVRPTARGVLPLAPCLPAAAQRTGWGLTSATPLQVYQGRRQQPQEHREDRGRAVCVFPDPPRRADPIPEHDRVASSGGRRTERGLGWWGSGSRLEGTKAQQAAGGGRPRAPRRARCCQRRRSAEW